MSSSGNITCHEVVRRKIELLDLSWFELGDGPPLLIHEFELGASSNSRA